MVYYSCYTIYNAYILVSTYNFATVNSGGAKPGHPCYHVAVQRKQFKPGEANALPLNTPLTVKMCGSGAQI